MDDNNIFVGVYYSEDEVRHIAERFGKLMTMRISQIVEALQPIADAFKAAFDNCDSLVMAEKLEALFTQPYEVVEVENPGTPPKKYGMSLRKCPRRTSVHYDYIPTAPRNLPYMRRAY